MITFTLSTFNTINYLKLAVQSVRENSYYKDAPFVIHAENCTDGTDEWLEEVKDKYNLEVYIEKNEKPSYVNCFCNCLTSGSCFFISFDE